MVDAGIGRLLIASLHQGIADVVPTRLPFYENWLTPPGMRDFRFGLAPLHAVLSFLRLEGRSPYEQIMRRAGRYTGEWGYAELSAPMRATVQSLPVSLRARWALRLSRRLVKQTFRGSSASVRLKRLAGTMEVRGSIFCAVRDVAEWPMCVFYSAAVERFLECFGLDAAVGVSQCKASGGSGCTMAVTIRGERAHEAVIEPA